MIILVDGNEMECEEIRIPFDDNVLVGCDGAGGSHREISGHYEVTLDSECITVDQISEVDKYNQSCWMHFNDLFGEMEKSIVVKRNSKKLEYIKGLFKS